MQERKGKSKRRKKGCEVGCFVLILVVEKRIQLLLRVFLGLIGLDRCYSVHLIMSTKMKKMKMNVLVESWWEQVEW